MASRTNIVKTVFVGTALVVLMGFIFHARSAKEEAPVVANKERMPNGVIKFAPNAPQLASIKVEAVTDIPMPIGDSINGRIAYDENVTTRITSPVIGRVLALHAELGDTVARGAVLADIDSPDFATAEADWRKAQADELRKKLAAERSKTLFDGEVLARKDYESADADFQQAKAETRRAGSRMKNLNATGAEEGKFRLKSPINGVVTDKQINPGLEVRPDLPNPLFVVTDFNHLWVIVDVPERSAAALHVGQAVFVETDTYPDERFAAKVDRIGIALDPVTRRVQVRCSLKNDGHKLKPEMFARVSFVADENSVKVIAIPNSSLFTEGIYSYVFVEKQPGLFEKRRVNVTVKGRERSFVDTGITATERVVTEGAFLLNAEVSSDAR